MKRCSKARLPTNSRIWKLVVAVLLAALSIPAQGGDDSPRRLTGSQPSATGGMTAIVSGSAQPVAPNAGTPPVRSASEPSFEQVMELLQAQGRELEALRAALREQQELTARLEAKLNSGGAQADVEEAGAESLATAQTIPHSRPPRGTPPKRAPRPGPDQQNS